MLPRPAARTGHRERPPRDGSASRRSRASRAGARRCGRAPATRRRAGRAGRARPRASPAAPSARVAPPLAGGARPRVDVEREGQGRAAPGAASGAAPAGRGPRRRRRRRPSARRAPPSASQPVSSCGAGRSAGRRPAPRAAGAVLRSAPRECHALLGLLAGRGDQPDGEAALGQVHRDRGGRRDRGLQRGGDARGRGGRPRRLSRKSVARDCQGCSSRRTISSPISRRAAPVHPAQVVAAAVLAHGDVLGAAGGEGPRPVVARAGPGAAERDLRQRDGARGDRQRRPWCGRRGRARPGRTGR